MAEVLIRHVGICCALWHHSCYNQSEMRTTQKFQAVLCINDLSHRLYQPGVMPYQARCYAISALQQATYLG